MEKQLAEISKKLNKIEELLTNNINEIITQPRNIVFYGLCAKGQIFSPSDLESFLMCKMGVKIKIAQTKCLWPNKGRTVIIATLSNPRDRKSVFSNCFKLKNLMKPISVCDDKLEFGIPVHKVVKNSEVDYGSTIEYRRIMNSDLIRRSIMNLKTKQCPVKSDHMDSNNKICQTECPSTKKSDEQKVVTGSFTLSLNEAASQKAALPTASMGTITNNAAADALNSKEIEVKLQAVESLEGELPQEEQVLMPMETEYKLEPVHSNKVETKAADADDWDDDNNTSKPISSSEGEDTSDAEQSNDDYSYDSWEEDEFTIECWQEYERNRGQYEEESLKRILARTSRKEEEGNSGG